MKRALAVALLCAVPFVSMADDDEAMMVPLKRLTMDTSMTIAKGAVDACRKEGIQIAVTVVDRNGLVQAVLRDTIASPVTLKISHQKAYTAANFNAATSAMSDRAGTPIGRVEGLVMSAGGCRSKREVHCWAPWA